VKKQRTGQRKTKGEQKGEYKERERDHRCKNNKTEIA
jgi:hypothetical protein